MTHRCVEVIAEGNPHKFGPGLPKVAGGLLRDLKMGELGWAEEVRINLNGKLPLGEGLFVPGPSRCRRANLASALPHPAWRAIHYSCWDISLTEVWI
jgi:hypothetical protein